MKYKVTTAPTDEPITLDEAKAQLRVELDMNVENDLIRRLITAARQWAETYMQRPIVTQTVTAKFPAFSARMALPYSGNLQSVTSVSYQDSDDATQTLATTVYGVDDYTEPAAIYLRHDQDWPETFTDPNAISVVYTAGYAVDDVPSDIKSALLLMIGHLFENREESIVGTNAMELPMGAKALLWQYRVLGV